MLALSLLSGAAPAAPDYGKRAQALEPAVKSRLHRARQNLRALLLAGDAE